MAILSTEKKMSLLQEKSGIFRLHLHEFGDTGFVMERKEKVFLVPI